MTPTVVQAVMPAVRPFNVWSDAALDHVRRRANDALQAWAQEWLGVTLGEAQARPTVHVKALGEGPTPVPGEYDAVRGALASLWVCTSGHCRSAFGNAVVGPELMPGGSAADDWVALAVDRAWSARDRLLCRALLGEPLAEGPLPPPRGEFAALLERGSGAVQITCEALGLHALADRSVMRDMPPAERGAVRRLPPAVAIEQAMRPATLHVEALLGSVELELDQVLDLRRGDVLRLPQRLDQRLSLSCAGRPLAGVELGETRGFKAIQVFAGCR